MPRSSLLHTSATTGSAADSPNRRRRSVLVVAIGLAVALLAPLFVSTAAADASTPTERHIAAAVGGLLNAERHAHHLKGVSMNAHLVSSARKHNLAMARANSMSHQLRGEASLSRRIERAGYHWTWNGENIGVNSRMTQAGVLALQRAMYNEHAPNNGHRRNILNSHFKNVGVDVYLDRAHHRVWLTVDFGRK